MVHSTQVQLASLSTTWPNTENPISQGGLFLQGGSDGSDWQNTQSVGGSPGIARATGTSAIGAFNDNICCLKQSMFSISPTKHYSQGTFHVAAGYSPAVTHETGLYTCLSISAHVAKGYEMNWGFGQGVQPVRWNGALGDFDASPFTTVSGSAFGVADGDVVKVTFDSSSGSPVITMQNITQSLTFVVTDTTAGKVLTGQPGFGFFGHPDASLDFTKYCLQGWAAGSA
jgi:hypothetical protein